MQSLSAALFLLVWILSIHRLLMYASKSVLKLCFDQLHFWGNTLTWGVWVEGNKYIEHKWRQVFKHRFIRGVCLHSSSIAWTRSVSFMSNIHGTVCIKGNRDRYSAHECASIATVGERRSIWVKIWSSKLKRVCISWQAILKPHTFREAVCRLCLCRDAMSDRCIVHSYPRQVIFQSTWDIVVFPHHCVTPNQGKAHNVLQQNIGVCEGLYHFGI